MIGKALIISNGEEADEIAKLIGKEPEYEEEQVEFGVRVNALDHYLVVKDSVLLYLPTGQVIKALKTDEMMEGLRNSFNNDDEV